jgi:hypothetical protein
LGGARRTSFIERCRTGGGGHSGSTTGLASEVKISSIMCVELSAQVSMGESGIAGGTVKDIGWYIYVNVLSSVSCISGTMSSVSMLYRWHGFAEILFDLRVIESLFAIMGVECLRLAGSCSRRKQKLL